MRTLLVMLALITVIFVFAGYCESKRNPYESGMHWDYNIHCENGFVYKTLSNRKGTIQVLNSDGTPLKCGHKIY